MSKSRSSRTRAFTLVEIMIIIAIIGILTALTLPALLRVGEDSTKRTCIDIMTRMEKVNEKIHATNINQLILMSVDYPQVGTRTLRCPAGGTYCLASNDLVVCSIPSHNSAMPASPH